jgi:hypothetical protein
MAGKIRVVTKGGHMDEPTVANDAQRRRAESVKEER